MYLETKELFVEPRHSAPLEVRAEPFSLESLVAWLETKDPDETYYYAATGHCLIAQYFTASGIKFYAIWCNGWDSKRDDAMIPQHPLPDHFNAVAAGGVGRTFGAALKRARSYLSSSERSEAAPTQDTEGGK